MIVIDFVRVTTNVYRKQTHIHTHTKTIYTMNSFVRYRQFTFQRNTKNMKKKKKWKQNETKKERKQKGSTWAHFSHESEIFESPQTSKGITVTKHDLCRFYLCMQNGRTKEFFRIISKWRLCWAERTACALNNTAHCLMPMMCSIEIIAWL